MFVPPADLASDYNDINDNSLDDNSWNDDNDRDVTNDDEHLREEVEFESVIIIVLATLLFTLLFFGGLIFYYARGKSYLQNFAASHEWPSDIRYCTEGWHRSLAKITN